MISRVFTRSLLAAIGVFASLAGVAAGEDLKDASRLYQQGEAAQALQQVNNYLIAKPRDAQARFLKGVILTDQKRTDDAIKVFTGLTEDYPELPEPYNNLAVLYASLGQYDRAKMALELAIRTHPSYATAHENLGDIYAQLASRAYDKALQLDKGNLAAQTKLSMIKELFGGARNRTLAAKPETLRADVARVEVARPDVPKTDVARADAIRPDTARPDNAKPDNGGPDVGKQVVVTTPAAVAVAEKPAALAKARLSKAQSAAAASELMRTVTAWSKAWSARNVPAYLAFYAADFETPNGESREDWEKQRTERLQNPKFVQISIAKPKVILSSASEATVVFRQAYRSNALKSVGSKTLRMSKSGNKWLIKSERSGN